MANAHQNYALISNNEVVNIIVCDEYQMANSLAQNILGLESFAIEVTQIPTKIGHTYVDGRFKDENGNVVLPLPTTEQEVATLKAENETLNQALTESTMLIATQQEQIDEQASAISELTILVAGGNA